MFSSQPNQGALPAHLLSKTLGQSWWDRQRCADPPQTPGASVPGATGAGLTTGLSGTSGTLSFAGQSLCLGGLQGYKPWSVSVEEDGLKVGF